MFAYNPTVNDNSGMIRGQGITNSAQIMGEAKVGMVDDIGSALVGLAGAYGQMQGTKAKGKNFKKFMGMAGETFGFDENQLSAFTDMEDYDAGLMLDNFGSWMPAMANAQLGRSRLGVQQNQPFVNAGLDDMANTAAGNQTITPGANDPANTVPLPEADTPLPAVQGAPGASPSVPGGRASWDARNRDRVKRGLQPLPYPPGLE